MTTNTKSDSLAGRMRAVALAAGRGFVLALVTLPGAGVLFTLTLVSMALLPVGVGASTTPWLLAGVRGFADWRRVLAAEWGGVRIPSVYQPVPKDANPWARTYAMVRDPAVW